jgi:hypothetical protein
LLEAVEKWCPDFKDDLPPKAVISEEGRRRWSEMAFGEIAVNCKQVYKMLGEYTG